MNDAQSMDDPVGKLLRDNFAAKLMILKCLSMRFLHGRRERCCQFVNHGGIGSNIAMTLNGVPQSQLGRRKQNCQLRPGQPLPLLDTAQQFFIACKSLHAPVQLAVILEYFDQANIGRSEEHTSELQSLMRISYAVFCLKKKKKHNTPT